jgi:hypothetical protein
MTALIIVLGIVIFLLFLLILPITVSANFENELTAKVSYLFFHYKILPQPEKPKQLEKNNKEKKEEKQEENSTISKIKGIINQKGLPGFLNIIKDFVSVGTGAAKKLFSRVTIQTVSVHIEVADEDAAQAAILYGYTCSVVYPAMSLLVNNLKCKEYQIHIHADFKEKKSKVQFYIKAQVRLLFILKITLTALLQSLKVLKDTRINTTKKNKENEKVQSK